jgi:hypothetical protein
MLDTRSRNYRSQQQITTIINEFHTIFSQNIIENALAKVLSDYRYFSVRTNRA